MDGIWLENNTGNKRFLPEKDAKWKFLLGENWQSILKGFLMESGQEEEQLLNAVVAYAQSIGQSEEDLYRYFQFGLMTYNIGLKVRKIHQFSLYTKEAIRRSMLPMLRVLHNHVYGAFFGGTHDYPIPNACHPLDWIRNLFADGM